MSPPKTCAVCGDKALGHNFNAVTCESCKAFFRRNALTRKQFTCPFAQNSDSQQQKSCEITPITRRFCQKCRLKKCLDIGMNSENIMSDEDKLIKRRKIENNRAMRKHIKLSKIVDEVQEEVIPADSSSWGDLDSQQSCTSLDSNSNIIKNNNNMNNNSNIESNNNSSITSPIASCSTTSQTIHELSGSEIVELIVIDPDRASQTINNLMRNKEDTLIALEKVILNSQIDDALRLISHLIAYPGDALKIISKLMNSPFNALNVFTKFMSSPTDGLEIISKVVSSPQDVLQFIRNLMDSPENALDIMNKFMNTPAEALKMLNRILSNTTSATSTLDVSTAADAATTSSVAAKPTTTTTTMTSDHSDNILLNTMLTTTSPSENVIVDKTKTSIIKNNAEKVKATHNNSVPTIMEDNTASTSSILNSNESNANYLSTAELETNSIDIQQLIQQIFCDNSSDSFHYLNSIDSVLSEVIRLEFNSSVSTDLQIKQEFSQSTSLPTVVASSSNGCHTNNNNDINTQQQNSINQSTFQPQSYVHKNNSNTPKYVNVSPTTTTISSDRILNEVEQMKLRELKKACEALYDPIDEEISMLDMGDGQIKVN